MWLPEPVGFAAADLAALVTDVTGADLHVALAPQAQWRDVEAQEDADKRLAELRTRYDGPTQPAGASVLRLVQRRPAELDGVGSRVVMVWAGRGP